MAEPRILKQRERELAARAKTEDTARQQRKADTRVRPAPQKRKPAAKTLGVPVEVMLRALGGY